MFKLHEAADRIRKFHEQEAEKDRKREEKLAKEEIEELTELVKKMPPELVAGEPVTLRGVASLTGLPAELRGTPTDDKMWIGGWGYEDRLNITPLFDYDPELDDDDVEKYPVIEFTITKPHFVYRNMSSLKWPKGKKPKVDHSTVLDTHPAIFEVFDFDAIVSMRYSVQIYLPKTHPFKVVDAGPDQGDEVPDGTVCSKWWCDDFDRAKQRHSSAPATRYVREDEGMRWPVVPMCEACAVHWYLIHTEEYRNERPGGEPKPKPKKEKVLEQEGLF